ncbi:MAG: hypothetical protein JXA94_02400 [Parachlamydiales bacterium]|nr:hypothetical protein [Parachlamydiales bacterium]
MQDEECTFICAGFKRLPKNIKRSDSPKNFQDIELLYRKVKDLRDLEKVKKSSSNIFRNKYCFWISVFISVYAALMIRKVLLTKKG